VAKPDSGADWLRKTWAGEKVPETRSYLEKKAGAEWRRKEKPKRRKDQRQKRQLMSGISVIE